MKFLIFTRVKTGEDGNKSEKMFDIAIRLDQILGVTQLDDRYGIVNEECCNIYCFNSISFNILGGLQETLDKIQEANTIS